MLFGELLPKACELAPIGLLLCDEKGNVLWVNKRVVAWFGFEFSELAHRPFQLLVPVTIPSDDSSHRACSIARQVSHPNRAAHTVIAKRKDDSRFLVDVLMEPFEHCESSYWLATIVDRKDRRQEECERQIDLDSMRSKMSEAERLATIGEIVRGLAHETHSSLQRAIGSLDLLDLDFAPNSEQKTISLRIRTALKDLHQTYREVGQYASPLHIAKRKTDLRDVCRRSFERLTKQSGQHSLKITGDIGHVASDPTQFGILFENLIQNSIDAATGPAAICVDMRRIGDQGYDWVELRFQDSSGGVSENAIRNVTEPFYTSKHRGTGLGLAICKRIAEAHGGTLAVSNSDNGLLVIVSIPVSRTSK